MSDVEDEKKRVLSSSSDDSGPDDAKDEPMKARLRAKRAKTSNIHSSSSEEDNSDDEKKNKKKGKKTGRKNGKASLEEDIEEGEVSDESTDEEPEFDDGYDENLIGDEADRERLSTMTEREREQEIFKRLEHREVLKRRFELEKKLKMRQKTGGNVKGGAVEDTSARSKERRLMVEGKKDTKAKAIENLRAAREEKRNRAAEQEKKKAAAKTMKKERHDTDSDDEDNLKDVERKKVDTSSDESDSDESQKEEKEEEKDHRLEPIKNMAELEKIRLSRFRIAKWIYLPFFADAVKGCFVRVNFGDNMVNGQPIYRVAEILGVLEAPKPYELKGEGGPKDTIKTNVMLRLRVFERERQMNLTFLSNQPLTEGEFEDFKNKMLEKDLSLPTMEHIDRKMMDIKRANAYRMTDADITVMVAAKEKLGMKPQNLAMRKAELLKSKVLAEGLGDEEMLAEIIKELREIDTQNSERHQPRHDGQTKIDAINKRNRNSAIEALGKALSTADKEKRDAERVADDPFTRRWGTPLLVHKKTLNGTAIPTEKKEEVKSAAAAPVVTPIAASTDPFSMHDFEIELNIDMNDFPTAASSIRRGGK